MKKIFLTLSLLTSAPAVCSETMLLGDLFSRIGKKLGISIAAELESFKISSENATLEDPGTKKLSQTYNDLLLQDMNYHKKVDDKTAQDTLTIMNSLLNIPHLTSIVVGYLQQPEIGIPLRIGDMRRIFRFETPCYQQYTDGTSSITFNVAFFTQDSGKKDNPYVCRTRKEGETEWNERSLHEHRLGGKSYTAYALQLHEPALGCRAKGTEGFWPHESFPPKNYNYYYPERTQNGEFNIHYIGPVTGSPNMLCDLAIIDYNPQLRSGTKLQGCVFSRDDVAATGYRLNQEIQRIIKSRETTASGDTKDNKTTTTSTS